MTTLGELIECLRAMPLDTVLPVGFREPHSWRGIYDDLAFEPFPDVSVAEMLKAAESAVGATFEGYKGGDFEMADWTTVHLSFYGSADDYWPLVALSPELAKARMWADDERPFARNFGAPDGA